MKEKQITLKKDLKVQNRDKFGNSIKIEEKTVDRKKCFR